MMALRVSRFSENTDGAAENPAGSRTHVHVPESGSVFPTIGLRAESFTIWIRHRSMISTPGSSLEYPRYSQEYPNHVTFAPPRGGRPDGAGWLPRRVRTDGRVKLSGKMVRAGYEPCTFEQQALFEDHSQHTFDRWRRPARDGQSGLPSTTLDYVSVTESSPT